MTAIKCIGDYPEPDEFGCRVFKDENGKVLAVVTPEGTYFDKDAGIFLYGIEYAKRFIVESTELRDNFSTVTFGSRTID